MLCLKCGCEWFFTCRKLCPQCLWQSSRLRHPCCPVRWASMCICAQWFSQQVQVSGDFLASLLVKPVQTCIYDHAPYSVINNTVLSSHFFFYHLRTHSFFENICIGRFYFGKEKKKPYQNIWLFKKKNKKAASLERAEDCCSEWGNSWVKELVHLF